MLSDATSGLKTAAGFTRSCMVIVAAPPVVRFTTQALRCLMIFRNGSKAAGDWSGRPSRGSRAWRCTIAAPASAAPIAASAISCGVIGRCGDIEGVWIEPVTAQLMMTLLDVAIVNSSWEHFQVVCRRRVSGFAPSGEAPAFFGRGQNFVRFLLGHGRLVLAIAIIG